MTRPCPCECNRGGHCGGFGHAGCGGRLPSGTAASPAPTRLAGRVAHQARQLISDAMEDLDVHPDDDYDRWLGAESELTLAVAAALLDLPAPDLARALAGGMR